MFYSWHMIGERIRNNRKEKNLTQEKIAEYLEQITLTPIKRQTIAGWENGKPIKKLEQLTALCEIFDCDISYLLCECDTKHINTQSISHSTGLSKNAIDTLIDLNQQNPVYLDIISKLLENKSLLYQIFSCCLANYNSVFNIQYDELFSSTRKITTIFPDKLERLDFLLLYDLLKNFIDTSRKIPFKDTP